jgi:hypothetical protein
LEIDAQEADSQKLTPSLRSRTVPGKAPAGCGPFPGLLFAVILPFIGIAMAVQLAARKIVDGLKEAAVKSPFFAWSPSRLT